MVLAGVRRAALRPVVRAETFHILGDKLLLDLYHIGRLQYTEYSAAVSQAGILAISRTTSSVVGPEELADSARKWVKSRHGMLTPLYSVYIALIMPT